MSEQEAETSSASAVAPEPWRLLGRDNPAGKALFNLYGGQKIGRGKGLEYTQVNKARLEKKLASGYSPPPLEPEKTKTVRPQVSVPRLVGKASSSELDMERRGPYIPHRRPKDQILEEIQQENERLRASPLPQPKGPLLDDAEKERLAVRMQFRGAPPAVTDQDRARFGRVPSRVKSRREELQDMFDSVMIEIEERKQFLDDLQAAGGLKQEHSHMVQGEIAQRIVELKKLNGMIAELDRSNAA